ncbi:MAG: cell division protein FtsL [Pseudohongiellaceae bacterium]
MQCGISDSKTLSGSSRSRTEIPSIIDWMGINNLSALTLIFMMTLTMVSGIAVVLKEHQNRTAFNELQELKDEGNELEVKWGQLLIEQSTFGVEGRVEEKAINELQMQLPVPAEIMMVNYD